MPATLAPREQQISQNPRESDEYHHHHHLPQLPSKYKSNLLLPLFHAPQAAYALLASSTKEKAALHYGIMEPKSLQSYVCPRISASRTIARFPGRSSGEIGDDYHHHHYHHLSASYQTSTKRPTSALPLLTTLLLLSGTKIELTTL